MDIIFISLPLHTILQITFFSPFFPFWVKGHSPILLLRFQQYFHSPLHPEALCIRSTKILFRATGGGRFTIALFRVLFVSWELGLGFALILIFLQDLPLCAPFQYSFRAILFSQVAAIEYAFCPLIDIGDPINKTLFILPDHRLNALPFQFLPKFR